MFSTLPDHQTWRPVASATPALDYRLGHSLNPVYFHLSALLWFEVLGPPPEARLSARNNLAWARSHAGAKAPPGR
ncbi:MAG TPA: hypothetical protein VE959_27420 [Bryobacteraceae bacterium]|nr:hypothetical protein SBA4_1060011 [Candidatus Sulfopaludibacter sp. SbA4]HYW46627.1 hypothetical protein [Bryobacteraceae bacterium]